MSLSAPSPLSLPENLPLAEVITRHGAPALLTDGHVILQANPQASLLLAQENWWPQVQSWLAGHAVGKFSVRIGEQMIEWQATSLPGPAYLLMGRDATLEHNLTLALVDSRSRYKDLLDLSDDYVWETDRAGRFAFVAATGLLGWNASEVTGKRPHELGLMATDAIATPFLTQVPVHDARLWIKDRNDNPRCLSISAIPHFDDKGAWLGARGRCHDITDEVNAIAQLSNARLRERIVGHIARIMSEGLSQEREFGAVVRALTHALSAEGTGIYRLAEGKWSLISSYSQNPPSSSTILCEATLNRGDALQLSSEGHEWLACRAQYNRRVNGAILVWRDAGADNWSADDISLVEAVAEQLGSAWAQLSVQEEWQEKAERDALTGLYNQGAFAEQVKARMVKNGGSGAVLVNIDLDNFKTINDHLGHAIGDDVLKKVSRIIEHAIRASDIAGRVGGDEFLIWLERTDAGGAQAVATRIITEIDELAESLGKLPKRLGASIGLAPVHNGENFAALIKRADSTMYKAKHTGKGHTETAE